ncbi:acyclic terpene utilization AtuA family protein, partial [Salmonella enterica]|uniref:acyclic terpene utilization AtuA family protein n=1 Tax=Salmonella enterica TaxID=28901 RepID=UPI003D2BF3AD
KPAGTGGAVTPNNVAEQIVYEIGDPRAYLLPDVTCDFSGVTVTAEGPDRVRVAGARGRAPTGRYKVSATYGDGFKASGTLMIGGREAGAKARRTGEAMLSMCRRLLAARGLPDYLKTSIEVL